jgi:hypothetical protein
MVGLLLASLQGGGLKMPVFTNKALENAVNLAHQRVDSTTRSGLPGGCTACGQSIESHFDGNRWRGCIAGQSTTVYILVAMQGGTDDDEHAEPRSRAPRSVVASVARGAARFRYFSTLHHRTKVEGLNLSAVREKVLIAIQASGKRGVIARDLRRQTRLPHGSVQQTLNWLREHKLVEAKEEA